MHIRFGTILHPRRNLQFAFGAVASLFYFSFTHHATKYFRESKFVNTDDALLLATAKYNFSMFDFAQAKKESHLKHMRRQLLEETGFSLLYTQPE